MIIVKCISYPELKSGLIVKKRKRIVINRVLKKFFPYFAKLLIIKISGY